MPFQDFHSCRMRDPEDFEEGSFRVVKQGKSHIVIGRPKGQTTTAAQAVRYPIGNYTEAEAKKACEARGGIRFEPAAPSIATASLPEIALTQSQFDRLLAGQEIAINEDTMQTEDIRNVEILAAGKWTDSRGHKVEITPEDIREMAENAKTLFGRVKPFLKLVHLDPKTHERVTGLPALGWLENFRAIGQKLVVDLMRVPAKVAALIRKGTFRRISAEVFTRDTPFKDEATGQKVPNVVTAAGILGAQLPAVTTLKDILALFSASAEPETSELEGAMLLTEWTNEGGDLEMDEKELKELLAKASREAAEAATKAATEATVSKLRSSLGIGQDVDPIAAIEKLKVVAKEGETQKAEFEKKEHDRRVDEVIGKFKLQGRLVPAQEPMIRKMLLGDLDEKAEFAGADGAKKQGNLLDSVVAYLESLPVQVKLGEAGVANDPMDRFAARDVAGMDIPEDVRRYAEENRFTIDEKSVELDRKIRKHAAENKVGYEDAMTFVTGASKTAEPIALDYSAGKK